MPRRLSRGGSPLTSSSLLVLALGLQLVQQAVYLNLLFEVLEAVFHVVGEQFGFLDFFVPVVSDGRCVAFLVAGAAAPGPLSEDALLRSWRELARSAPEPFDMEFAELRAVCNRIAAGQSLKRCVSGFDGC